MLDVGNYYGDLQNRKEIKDHAGRKEPLQYTKQAGNEMLSFLF